MDPLKLIGFGIVFIGWTLIALEGGRKDEQIQYKNDMNDWTAISYIGVAVGVLMFLIGFIMIFVKGLKAYGIYLP